MVEALYLSLNRQICSSCLVLSSPPAQRDARSEYLFPPRIGSDIAWVKVSETLEAHSRPG